MAIIQYHDHDVTPSVAETLKELSEYAYSTKAFLSMLGDYWTEYFKDTVNLSQAHTGSIAAAGRQLTKLYELLLSANILDFPVEQGAAFDLLVFDRDDFEIVYDENGEIDSYFVSFDGCDIQNFEYLTTSLFESAVVLAANEHFKVADGGVYFYVDIFEDPSISAFEYSLSDESVHKVLLWASPVVVNHYYMYERYGRFIYQKALDGYKYKWLMTGLMRYYTGAKSCANMERVLDILFGIPYCRGDEETIVSIEYTDADLNGWTETRTDEASYIRITTDKRVYYTYALSELLYGVGDTVKRNEMFARFSQVLDYINCPNWWETEARYFPEVALDGNTDSLTKEELYDIMGRLLKYNTVYININVTYESWELYKQIVDELYAIIDRGFPVYLNAYIEKVFRSSFSDDTDFMPRTGDDWFEIFQHLWLYDEFCKIIRYTGFIHEHGFWRYGLWDHRDGRMLDYLDVCMEPTFRDPVLYPKECPLYDGEFFALGDIQHDCYGDMFAWDQWTRHIHLTPKLFTDYVTHDDGPMPMKGFVPNYFDWFCEPKPYKGIRRYDGRTIHYLWGGIPGTRMTDPQRMIVILPALFDCVGGEPFYNGDHEHEGDIDHQPDRDFAKDIFGTLWTNSLFLFDYVGAGTWYDERDIHDGDISYQPRRDFARDEFSMDGAWKLEYFDFFCAPYLYTTQTLFNGKAQYYLWHRTKNHRLTDKASIDLKLPALFDCFGYKPWYDGEYEHEGNIDHQPDRDFATDELSMHVSGYRFVDFVVACPCYDDQYDHEGDIDHDPDSYFATDEFSPLTTMTLDVTEVGQEFSDEFVAAADCGNENTAVESEFYDMVSFGTNYGFEEYATDISSDFIDSFAFVVGVGDDDVSVASDEFEIVGYRDGETVYF